VGQQKSPPSVRDDRLPDFLAHLCGVRRHEPLRADRAAEQSRSPYFAWSSVKSMHSVARNGFHADFGSDRRVKGTM
jgi:hypothetical protein